MVISRYRKALSGRAAVSFIFKEKKMTDSMKISVKKLTASAMLLAIGILLPSLTMNIPEIGNMLCPMHIPVLLCGAICGWKYGLAVGALTPILRFTLFMPGAVITKGIPMMFELAAYAVLIAVLLRVLPKKQKAPYVYTALIGAMLGGRIIWAAVRLVMSRFMQNLPFSFSIFAAEAFVNAVPGIIIQLILIPALLLALEKAKLIPID